LAFAIEAIDIVIDLRAMRAEAGVVAIDSFLGVLKPAQGSENPTASAAARMKRTSFWSWALLLGPREYG
jgi:hypothetical protein